MMTIEEQVTWKGLLQLAAEKIRAGRLTVAQVERRLLGKSREEVTP